MADLSQLSRLQVFSGSVHPNLTEGIVKYLNIKKCNITSKRFSDGEIWVKFEENLRGNIVCIVQPTTNDHSILELLIMIDAAKRASADKIIAMIPYYGYARQDRKDQPHVSISAKLMADLITTAGADRVITMDVHANQIQGFFNIPFDHIYSSYVLLPKMNEQIELLGRDRVKLIAPDLGSANMVNSWANRLGVGMAIVNKRRNAHNQVEIKNIIGDVKDSILVIVDDIIDTCNTFYKSCVKLIEAGALELHGVFIHPILSGNACNHIEELINNYNLKSMTITNSRLPMNNCMALEKILNVVDVSALLGETLKRAVIGDSISNLYLGNEGR